MKWVGVVIIHIDSVLNIQPVHVFSHKVFLESIWKTENETAGI